MLTRFKRGTVTYSLLTAPKARREWEIGLDEISADPTLWSAHDLARDKVGALKDRHELSTHRKPARRVRPLTHYSDKGRKRK